MSNKNKIIIALFLLILFLLGFVAIFCLSHNSINIAKELRQEGKNKIDETLIREAEIIEYKISLYYFLYIVFTTCVGSWIALCFNKNEDINRLIFCFIPKTLLLIIIAIIMCKIPSSNKVEVSLKIGKIIGHTTIIVIVWSDMLFSKFLLKRKSKQTLSNCNSPMEEVTYEQT